MTIRVLKKIPQFPRWKVGLETQVNNTLAKTLIDKGYAEDVKSAPLNRVETVTPKATVKPKRKPKQDDKKANNETTKE